MYEVAIYESYGCSLITVSVTNDRGELSDIIHDLMTENRGAFCVVENTETGETVEYSERDYFDRIRYEGDIEIDI